MNFSAPVKITDVYLICFCYVHVPRSVDLYLQLFANKKKKSFYYKLMRNSRCFSVVFLLTSAIYPCQNNLEIAHKLV